MKRSVHCRGLQKDCVKFNFLKDEKNKQTKKAQNNSIVPNKRFTNAKYQKVSYVTCMIFKLVELILSGHRSLNL